MSLKDNLFWAFGLAVGAAALTVAAVEIHRHPAEPALQNCVSPPKPE